MSSCSLRKYIFNCMFLQKSHSLRVVLWLVPSSPNQVQYFHFSYPCPFVALEWRNDSLYCALGLFLELHPSIFRNRMGGLWLAKQFNAMLPDGDPTVRWQFHVWFFVFYFDGFMDLLPTQQPHSPLLYTISAITFLWRALGMAKRNITAHIEYYTVLVGLSIGQTIRYGSSSRRLPLL